MSVCAVPQKHRWTVRMCTVQSLKNLNIHPEPTEPCDAMWQLSSYGYFRTAHHFRRAHPYRLEPRRHVQAAVHCALGP